MKPHTKKAIGYALVPVLVAGVLVLGFPALIIVGVIALMKLKKYEEEIFWLRYALLRRTRQ